jgi:hypothetical protein
VAQGQEYELCRETLVTPETLVSVSSESTLIWVSEVRSHHWYIYGMDFFVNLTRPGARVARKVRQDIGFPRNYKEDSIVGQFEGVVLTKGSKLLG